MSVGSQDCGGLLRQVHRRDRSALVGKALSLVAAVVLGACAAPDSVPAEPRLRAAVADLERSIRYEMRDKQIDRLSIALLDGDRVVWARGFGDDAGARTVYPVGSISKLFTAVAVMQAVERGELELDAPVSTWVPELAPPVGALTLRQLLSHRSGLIREPARGSYFDPTGASLDEAARSLRPSDVVYEPGSRFKYSNAGPSVAGLVLARCRGERFEEIVDAAVSEPLDLDDTAFAPGLGIGPAVGLRTSAVDLVRFAGSWFATDPAAGSPLRPATWRAMWAGADQVGLGFFLGELDGALRVGHDGDAFGYSAVVSALPERRVAVAVLADAGGTVAVLDGLATRALRWMIAARSGGVLEPEVPPQPLGAEAARRLAGRYGDQDFWVDLFERDGELVADMTAGHRALVRRRGEQLVLDGRSTPHWPVQVRDEGVVLYGRLRLRLPDPEAEPVIELWSGLVGRYGTTPVVQVRQSNGRLCLAIDGFDVYPLSELGDDHFAFPDHGAFAGEAVVFERSAGGRATAVRVGAVRFDR